jgi:hypothetical protein
MDTSKKLREDSPKRSGESRVSLPAYLARIDNPPAARNPLCLNWEMND